MESIKKEALIRLTLGVMVLIWVGVLQATGTPLSYQLGSRQKITRRGDDLCCHFVLVHEMAMAVAHFHVQGLARAGSLHTGHVGRRLAKHMEGPKNGATDCILENDFGYSPDVHFRQLHDVYEGI